MLSKQEIKFIKSLSQKKYREENSMFVAEGEKLVTEILSSHFEVVKTFYRDEIGEENMSRISLLSSPSPVLAVVKIPEYTEVPAPDNSKLALALDSVRDPGNLGTIVRIADWFGIDTIYASEDTVDLYNPKCVQATMGAISRVRVFYTELSEFLSIHHDKTDIYGTFLGAPSIYEVKLGKGGIIVMGNESDGISQSIGKLVTKKIMIPPYPADSERGESLNVAIATAVVCAEFRRPSGGPLQK